MVSAGERIRRKCKANLRMGGSIQAQGPSAFCMVITSIVGMHQGRTIAALLLIAQAMIAHGQVIFENELEVAGGAVNLQHIEVLPDGDLLIAGVAAPGLLLFRSTASGDTVWTRKHPGLGARDLRSTLDGRISAITNQGVCVFDPQNGDVLDTVHLPGASLDQGRGHWWTALDSVLCVTTDSLFYLGTDGAVQWSVGVPLLEPIYEDEVRIELSHVLRTAAGRIVAGGRKMWIDHDIIFRAWPWFGVYDGDGVLLDSVTVFDIGPHRLGGVRGLDAAMDGGYLAFGLSMTARPYWVRGTAEAEFSVLLWGNVERTDEVREHFYVSGAALRPNGNIVTVGHVGDFVNADEDRAIMEINSADSVICYRLLNSAVSGYGPPWDLALTQEGHTVFVGADDSDQNPGWGNCLNWTAIDLICESTASIAATGTDAVRVYPQPSSGVFRVQGAPNFARSTVRIVDARGVMVQEHTSNTPELRIDLTGHAPGLYHARITSADGRTFSHPLLLIE